MQALTQAALEFGGSNTYSGVSTSRTLMLGELNRLLQVVAIDADPAAYRIAIIDDNALLKPSAVTRSKTYAYLRDRFALDPDVGAFAVLRMLWDRDVEGRPLIALLIAALRDPILRSTFPFMAQIEPDHSVGSRDYARVIADTFPGKLRPKTLKSTSENTTSTFKQSGHLLGRARCVRRRVEPTPGSVTLALILASLNGAGGFALLNSPWVSILDGSPEQILSQARIASSRGWLELRQAGDVLELSFHALLFAIGQPR